MLANWTKEMWNTGCMCCKASGSPRQAAWEETNHYDNWEWANMTMAEFLRRMLDGDVPGGKPNLVACLKPRNRKAVVSRVVLLATG